MTLLRSLRLTRFNADGSLDISYGPSGTGVVAAGLGSDARTSAMALQADGRAVVVGYADDVTLGLRGFALTRYVGSSESPSPVQVGSLAAVPSPVTAGSPLTLTADGVTTTNAGATVTMVAFYAVDGYGVEQFLGYATPNTDGTWTLTFSVNIVPGLYTLLALAADSNGAVSDPFSLSLEVL